MHYVILDLEWNQAPSKALEHPGLSFEIIEIGAVRMEEDGSISDEFDALIRPEIYPEVFSHVRQVVHMSGDFLRKNGRPFSEVLGEFVEWCGEDAVFCTWGPMDLTEFQKNINYFGLKNPFPFPLYYLDVQKLFSLEYEDGRTRLSLETAIDRLGLFIGEPFHRAVSDAYYTGLVLAALPREKYRKMVSIDYFRIPKNAREELYLVFDGYSKFVSQSYLTRDEAMLNHNVTSTVCYRCGNNVKRRVQWFADNTKHYYSLSYCPVHGWLKGKIRIKKAPDGGVFAVKTLKLVDSRTAEQITQKSEVMKARRQKERMEYEHRQRRQHSQHSQHHHPEKRKHPANG